MTERLKVCIDRVLPGQAMRFQALEGRGNNARAIVPIGKLWMNGSTLRVRFVGGSAAQQTKARQQALWWSAVANLEFDFNDAPAAEIRIAFDANDGAWSYVGTDCRGIPLDQPTMNLGFMDGGTAGHEFGHAIGLAHEHQNPAGGIEWNEAVVLHDLAGPPNSWDAAQIRHNVLGKYTAAQIKGTAFDPDSIMLYFFPGTWVKSGVGTHANEVLSAVDKSYIAGAQAYPHDRPTLADAVEIKVNALRRTPAAIGKAGEEDVFRFQVGEGGRHVIDTRGPSDVVMKLYGPDSPTALIAEDDDSGVDANARLLVDLTPGAYWIQVRHYDSRGGTGQYSVKVRRQ